MNPQCRARELLPSSYQKYYTEECQQIRQVKKPNREQYQMFGVFVPFFFFVLLSNLVGLA